MATNMVAGAEDVGLLVRETREAEGFTQQALAAEAHVGRQWLNAFEAGDKPSAPLDMVMRVLGVLNLEVTFRPQVTLPSGTVTTDDLAFSLDEILGEG